MAKPKSPEEIQAENTDISLTSLELMTKHIGILEEQLEVSKDIAGFLERIADAMEAEIEEDPDG